MTQGQPIRDHPSNSFSFRRFTCALLQAKDSLETRNADVKRLAVTYMVSGQG